MNKYEFGEKFLYGPHIIFILIQLNDFFYMSPIQLKILMGHGVPYHGIPWHTGHHVMMGDPSHLTSLIRIPDGDTMGWVTR